MCITHLIPVETQEGEKQREQMTEKKANNKNKLKAPCLVLILGTYSNHEPAVMRSLPGLFYRYLGLKPLSNLWTSISFYSENLVAKEII